MPRPTIGKGAAVQDTTTSKRGSASPIWSMRIVLAPKREASACARSSVRLATVIDLGLAPPKWAAQSSIISPAPMNSTCWSETRSKMRSVRCTAAAAIDTVLAPIAVVERTSLATAKVFWNSLCSSTPMVPASSAWRTASLT